MEKKDCETQEVEIQPFYVEFGIRDSNASHLIYAILAASSKKKGPVLESS